MAKDNLTWDELTALCLEHGWELDCDNDGQIVLYTGWDIDSGYWDAEIGKTKPLADLDLES